MAEWVDLLDSANQKYDNTTSGLTADNVKDAIDELEATGGGGGGDVSGPVDSTDNELVLFDGITGKQIKASTLLDSYVLAWTRASQHDNLAEELTPNPTDTVLIEETGLGGFKRRVPLSALTLSEAPDNLSRTYVRDGTAGAWVLTLKGYGEIIQTTAASGPEALNIEDGNFIVSNLTNTYTLTTIDCDLTSASLTWVLQHNGFGVSFPASFNFPGGTAPSGASGNTWILGLFTNNSGTDWVVTYVEDYTL